MGRFTELEDKLYLWIDSMRRASLPTPPTRKRRKLLNNYQYRRMTSKDLGSGLAGLENAVDYNNCFLTVKKQRWKKKIFIFWKL